MLAARDIAEIDTDLAILDLAQPPAPLPLNPHRLGSLLGEGGRIENQNAVVFAQLRPDLPRQLLHERPVVPLRLTHELLQALPLAVMQIGDRLNVLAVQVRQQTLDVVLGIGPLLRRLQSPDKRLQERLQTRQHALEQAGPDLCIVQ